MMASTTKHFTNGVLAIACAGALVGCVQEGDTYAPDHAGGGQPIGTTRQVEYAPGPFGVGVGSIISDYSFLGFPNPEEDAEDLHAMRLGDFYNPTGEGVFPDDSPYRAGEPLPKALLIANSAGWCGPCMYEAVNVLDPEYNYYLANGGDFVVSIEEGADYEPATKEDLQEWVNGVNFPSHGVYPPSGWVNRWPAINNPTGTLWPIIGVGAFPAAIVVRTEDMKIAHVEIGASSAIFGIFDEVIDGSYDIPGV